MSDYARKRAAREALLHVVTCRVCWLEGHRHCSTAMPLLVRWHELHPELNLEIRRRIQAEQATTARERSS